MEPLQCGVVKVDQRDLTDVANNHIFAFTHHLSEIGHHLLVLAHRTIKTASKTPAAKTISRSFSRQNSENFLLKNLTFEFKSDSIKFIFKII